MSRTDLVVYQPAVNIRKRQWLNFAYILVSVLALGGLLILWIYLDYTGATKVLVKQNGAKPIVRGSNEDSGAITFSAPNQKSVKSSENNANNVGLQSSSSNSTDLPADNQRNTQQQLLVSEPRVVIVSTSQNVKQSFASTPRVTLGLQSDNEDEPDFPEPPLVPSKTKHSDQLNTPEVNESAAMPQVNLPTAPEHKKIDASTSISKLLKVIPAMSANVGVKKPVSPTVSPTVPPTSVTSTNDLAASAKSELSPNRVSDTVTSNAEAQGEAAGNSVVPSLGTVNIEDKDRIAVIVNWRNTQSIDRQQLRDIYLDRISRWGNGTEITVYNLPVSSAVRELFSQQVLNMTALDAATLASNRSITNQQSNRMQTRRDNVVAHFVAENPSAIGYVPIDVAREKSNIRILFTINNQSKNTHAAIR